MKRRGSAHDSFWRAGLTCVEAAARRGISGAFLLFSDVFHAKLTMPRRFSVEGTRLNRARIDEMLGRSLMLVTAFSPVIGYDKAPAIAHKAKDEGLTLKEAVVASGYID